ncbi:unnamed protein product [Chrysoparadoxa australica]
MTKGKNLCTGCEAGDPVSHEVLKVLRLLYVQDLRWLQDDVNDLISTAQAHMANPRTNTTLGKVGR